MKSFLECHLYDLYTRLVETVVSIHVQQIFTQVFLVLEFFFLEFLVLEVIMERSHLGGECNGFLRDKRPTYDRPRGDYVIGTRRDSQSQRFLNLNTCCNMDVE